MKEPARWRDPRGGADAETRSLLLDDRPPVPRAAEVKRVWSSLSSRLASLPLPLPIPPAPPATGAAAAAATGTLLGKITVIAVTTAIGAGVGWHGFRAHRRATTTDSTPTVKVALRGTPSRAGVSRSLDPVAASASISATADQPQAVQLPMAKVPVPTEPDPSSRKRTRPVLPASAVRQPSPPVGPEPVWPPVPWPSPAEVETRKPPVAEAGGAATAMPLTVATPVPASSQVATSPRITARPSVSAMNTLLEESRHLASARAALHSHDSDRALELLSIVPGSPALAQEREALTIEAMVNKPALRAAATERARAFLRAYPDSPYRIRVTSFISERK